MTIKTRMEARSPREKDLLKYGVKQGIEQERERIIKLLEDDYESQDGIIKEQGHLDELIALIKEE